MRIAKSKVHFIGIGGIGMCGLAELLHNMGAKVSGSDLSQNTNTEHLSSIGIKVFQGHKAEWVHDTDVVVFSSAIKSHNVEYREAKRKKIPLIARAEALAEIMRMKRGVAIAGTHGKTTTTSLTSSIFLESEKDPTIVVGGRVAVLNSTALLGKGEWLIAEADESDGSFHRLSPEVVVVTNIDDDHLDFYGSFKNLQRAFYDFALRIPFYGALIYCGDDSKTRSLFEDFPKKKVSYGFDTRNDYSLKSLSAQEYEISYQGEPITCLKLPIAGDHNALNALGAILASNEAGIEVVEAAQAISNFKGVERRFQFKGQVNDIDFYDDYGHHPTEVKTVLEAFEKMFPERRKVVLFQPHRYSRTQNCWEEFLSSFKDADLLYVTDIYAAGEGEIKGIHSEILTQQIEHSQKFYVPLEGLVDQVQAKLSPEDVVITLGAGHIWRYGEKLMSQLSLNEQ